ncbi:MAG: PQQ-binding-like beta-propeller repeat protein [Cyclobacteriaceae bacterium]
MKRFHPFLFSLFLALSCEPKGEANYPNKDWPVYLGDRAASHYSQLAQIDANNVSQLKVAWTYNCGDADPKNRSQIQCNPIIVNGVLYGSSAKLKFFALNAGTGEELWSFDPFEGKYDSYGMGVNRGLVYWQDKEYPRILCTAGSFLYALNAKTGELIESFGKWGKVDLHQGLGEDAKDLLVTSNTPGVIYKDLLILGTRVSESAGAAPGYIRAFNARTGAIAWTFHTIPKPGEYGYETWPEDAWKRVGGANAWSGMTVDENRGMVFIPLGSASYDFYGGDRHGENLFANCLLALNAETGERIWHYQTVHHDIWDRDLPASPNLVTVNHDGEEIDAVAQITKSGFVFLFNRETGKPLFPIEEHSAPTSDLPGEQAWPTQPVPRKPEPFARQLFTKDQVTDLSPEATAYVLDILKRTRTGERFIPPSREGTIIFPGYDGGGEWGGAAYDPTSNLLYVNANEMAWILTMVEADTNTKRVTNIGRGKAIYRQFCAGCHGAELQGGDFMGNVPSLVDLKQQMIPDSITSLIKKGRGAMPGFAWMADYQINAIKAYLFDLEEKELSEKEMNTAEPQLRFTGTGYIKFYDQNGYPALKPPLGTLNAIDLNKGEIKWQVPLGEHPKLKEKGVPTTGSENYGGPVVTVSGLLFIAATLDEKIRAFDKTNGDMLWETDLPAAGYATPSTYMVDGKQYVVIACGGGKLGTKSGDAYVAFSLP